MATPKIIADFETSLATPVAVGAVAFTLTSATDDDGIALPAGLYYFTFDNASAIKEYVACTLSGVSCTGVLSVSRQGTETSGFVRAHRVGASVIMTDFATYKKYMDGVALAGTTDADTNTKGVSEIATQAEVDAKTAIGGTFASLAVRPDTLRSTKMNDYVVDTGLANAYVIAPVPAITAYITGQIFVFKAINANTVTSTINVNGLGVKTIKQAGGAALVSGNITANQMVTVVYDGTDFYILSSFVQPFTAPTVQLFTASGTYTKPAGLKYILVEGVGAGCFSLTSQSAGAGGYFKKLISASALGATEVVTVGAVGYPAGNTSFGSFCTGNGGGNFGVGIRNPGGGASGGDINIGGGNGTDGGSGGTGNNYGMGGNSMLGFAAANNTGATGFGAGAAGAAGGATNTSGTNGVVIVTEYYS